MPLFRDDEDLFKSSTMSFGEHLEELRGALWRSVIGLAVALAIAYPFSYGVVRFVEVPLKRALGKHYLATAADELLRSENAELSLTDWRLFSEREFVPRRVKFDLESIRRELRRTSDLSPPSGSLVLAGIGIEVSRDRATRWVEQLVLGASESDGTPVRIIWDLLPPDVQTEIRQAAQLDGKRAGARDFEPAKALETALSFLLTSDALANSTTLVSQAQKAYPEESELLDTLVRASTSAGREDARKQLNRLLLACAFPEHMSMPGENLIEITIWEPAQTRIQALGVPEAFIVWMKAWFVLAAILASPWICYQIWQFVAAGLYGHERKLVYLLLPASLGLFLLGAALAFAFVFDPVLDFLFAYNRRLGINIEPRFNDWIGFVLLLPLGFGISFQLPLVMVALERLGIVTVATLVSRWRFAVLGIFFVSMILTPADPISMLLMAIPLTALYFGGIVLCRHLSPSAPARATLARKFD
jgi:sec-independent protein translocase protein TatC